MMFRVPIQFDVKSIPKGKRKAVTAPAFEWIDVEIADIAEENAPVATRWYSERLGRTIETRWHEGSHWARQSFWDADRTTETLATVTTTEDLLADGNPHSVGLSSGYKLRDFAAGEHKVFDEEDHREISMNERPEAIQKVHNCAEHLIVIGEEIWTRVNEPVFHYSRNKVIRTPEGPIIPLNVIFLPDDQSAHDATNTFSVLSHQDVVDTIAERHPSCRVGGDGPVTVFIQDSLRHCAEAQELLLRSKGFVESDRRGLGTCSIPFIRAWADLSEACERAEADWNEETTEALENALQVYADVRGDDYFGDEALKVLDRWRMRSIESTPSNSY